MKPICLCADDYAISPAVSRGICELVEAKRLSAVSVMVTTDYWADWSQKLLPFCTDIDIGLHITLTNLKPIGEMPKFASNGCMPSIGKVVKMAYLRCLPYHEIQMEIERQLQRFYLYFGRWPSHVDGHHHVHVLPGIREIIVGLFYKILDPQQCYIRNCVEDISSILRRGVACKKAIGISFLSFRSKAQLKKHDISTNDGFAGVYTFSPQAEYGCYFRKFLIASKDQMLIMCHPGYVDDELKMQDSVLAPREAELKFFLSKEFKELMERNDFALLPLRNRIS